MFEALKPGLSKLVFSYSEYMTNFIPKRTAAASRGFLAAAQLSCLFGIAGLPESLEEG